MWPSGKFKRTFLYVDGGYLRKVIADTARQLGVPPPSNPESRAAYLNYTKHLIDKPKKQSKLLRRGGKAAAGLGALGAVGGLGVAGHKTLKSKFSKQ